MTALPQLKLRVSIPFPTQVSGAGGISVSKSNGIWTIEPDFSVLSELSSIPTPTTLDTWAYDTSTGVYYRVPVQLLLSQSVQPRIVTAAGTVTVATTDIFIALHKTVADDTDFQLPSYNTKIGAVTIWDADGVFNSHTIRVLPFGTEKFFGTLTEFPMTGQYQVTTFRPTSLGWVIS